MDWATPAGMAIAAAALIISILMDGGHISQLWNLSALILVVGGTVGFTVTTFRLSEIARLPVAILRAFVPPSEDREALLSDLVRMAEAARRDGILVLQDRLGSIAHPLMRRGLGLVIDGIDPEKLRETLLEEIEVERRDIEDMAAVLEQAGGYAPTVGIIGTVMGLVHVLGNLSEAEKLGPAIAVAFMATFYGIFTANFFWLPLGAKIRAQAQRTAETGHMILVGLTSIYTGENPSVLREKLEVFVRRGAGAGKSGAAGRLAPGGSGIAAAGRPPGGREVSAAEGE